MTISAERPTVVAADAMVPPASKVVLPWRQRPGSMSQHVGTAIGLAVLGYALGHWFGNAISSNYAYIENSGQNSIADALGLAVGVLGWLVGIGALNYPLAKIVGKEAGPPDARA